MATYLDGMDGGKHNSDDAIASYTAKIETKHKIEWQKTYDIQSEIQYLEEENPGEHFFSINRVDGDGFWFVEEDECYALVQNGKLVGYEGYSTHPSEEEQKVIEKILMEKNII